MKRFWNGWVDAAARACGFPVRADFVVRSASAASAKPADIPIEAGKPAKAGKAPKRHDTRDFRKSAVEVRQLADEGLPRVEIARRTGLSQDVVGMLLNIAPPEAAESAAGGTFFRILRAQLAS
jgi:hypothetical protein